MKPLPVHKTLREQSHIRDLFLGESFRGFPDRHKTNNIEQHAQNDGYRAWSAPRFRKASLD